MMPQNHDVDPERVALIAPEPDVAAVATHPAAHGCDPDSPPEVSRVNVSPVAVGVLTVDAPSPVVAITRITSPADHVSVGVDFGVVIVLKADCWTSDRVGVTFGVNGTTVVWRGRCGRPRPRRLGLDPGPDQIGGRTA
jgi:hypothetical protein